MLNTNYNSLPLYQSKFTISFSSLKTFDESLHSSAGTDNATVYGLFLCRGDVSPGECQTCLKTATDEALTTSGCPNQTRGNIFYDECMLRFSNQPILSKMDAGLTWYLWNSGNYTNGTLLSQVLSDTFDAIATKAADGADFPGKKFAVQEAGLGVFENIYALAQCTPDLTSLDCNSCLRLAISQIPNCCTNRPGGRVICPSCIIWYESFPFYENPTPAPPPMVPPPSLPTPATPSGTTADPGSIKGDGGISTTTILAIIIPIVVGIVVFVAIIIFCVTKRTRKRREPEVNDETTGPDSRDGGALVRLAIAIGFSIISFVVLFFVCLAFWKSRSRKRHNGKRRAESAEEDIAIDPESLQYSLSEIVSATNNFSTENKIGKGGFGVVYKGELPNGRKIAVKRLLKRSGQGASEFKNEIAVVAKLQHKNLVQLLGFCLEGGEKILVYEFVPERSLDYFLFDHEKQGLLNWSRRRNIIGGIAKGLLYLHEDSRLTIVHRDLKAGNILLDASMNPKIADFGLAKIWGVEEYEGNTDKIAGTYGYMAPEYLLRGQYSAKSDVFSFGVVILEIITGKRSSNFYNPEDSENLISHVWKQWTNNTPLALLDPTIGRSYVKTEVIQCVQIGLLCVEEDANNRPTMASVVHMLNSSSVSLPTPNHPVISWDGRSRSLNLELGSKPLSLEYLASVDKASITELCPR